LVFKPYISFFSSGLDGAPCFKNLSQLIQSTVMEVQNFIPRIQTGNHQLTTSTLRVTVEQTERPHVTLSIRGFVCKKFYFKLILMAFLPKFTENRHATSSGTGFSWMESKMSGFELRFLLSKPVSSTTPSGRIISFHLKQKFYINVSTKQLINSYV